jgi:mannose-6-phosphate isomerase-like protein (cupin superfamily)
VRGRADLVRESRLAVPSIAVEAPLGNPLRSVGPTTHRIDPAWRCKDGRSFAPIGCFMGRTEHVDSLECHYSVLMPGASPHSPHAHREEEILVVMSGAAELVVQSSVTPGVIEIFPAPAGTAIYYPSFQPHTIRNASAAPVIYAMLRWASESVGGGERLIPCLVQSTWLQRGDPARAISMGPLFQGPTAFLGMLHAHTTRIEPGGGYDAHSDTHDVAIFLLTGEIAIMGQRIRAPAISFIPAGYPHDMDSIGPDPARYLVWEFHRDVTRYRPVAADQAGDEALVERQSSQYRMSPEALPKDGPACSHV